MEPVIIDGIGDRENPQCGEELRVYECVEGVLEGVSGRRALQTEGERAKALGREGGMGLSAARKVI